MRPPAQERLPFLGHDPLEQRTCPNRCGPSSREREERAHAIMLGLGQRDPQGLAAAREELVGDLDQEPRAVAGVIFTSACTAMIHVEQRGEPVAHELMRSPPLQVDDEPHAAAIVLVTRVVQTLGFRLT